MAMLDDAKTLLGVGSEKNAVLTLLISQTEQDFKDYCNRTDIPDAANGVVLNMVCANYNQLGAQGLASQNYSSISESYLNGYSESILKQLNHYRKVKLL